MSRAQSPRRPSAIASERASERVGFILVVFSFLVGVACGAVEDGDSTIPAQASAADDVDAITDVDDEEATLQTSQAAVTCQSWQYIHRRQCVSSCPAGFPVHINRRCRQACPPRAPVSVNGACVAACPANLPFVAPNGSCTAVCPDNARLLTSDNRCVSGCPPHEPYLNGISCVATCPATAPYVGTNFGRHNACVSLCPYGTVAPGSIFCAQTGCSTYIHGNTCVASCPASSITVPGSNGLPGRCLDCPVWASGFSCVSTCPQYTAPYNRVCELPTLRLQPQGGTAEAPVVRDILKRDFASLDQDGLYGPYYLDVAGGNSTCIMSVGNGTTRYCAWWSIQARAPGGLQSCWVEAKIPQYPDYKVIASSVRSCGGLGTCNSWGQDLLLSASGGFITPQPGDVRGLRAVCIDAAGATLTKQLETLAPR